MINVNFPPQTVPETSILNTFPAKVRLGSLFAEERPGVFKFRFNHGEIIAPDANDDRSALASGKISRSVLDFSRIGRR